MKDSHLIRALSGDKRKLSILASWVDGESANKLRKAMLLCLLYFFQTAPKGYLNYLPIVLREHKATLKEIASLSMFTTPELLKPLFAWGLDLKLLQPHKTKVILALETALIALFIHFSSLSGISMSSLSVLYGMTSLLAALHDSCVDGLAVTMLRAEEQPAGAFGQYFGYKLGTLVTGGVLPLFLGEDHRALCRCVVGTMAFTHCVVILLLSNAKTAQPPSSDAMKMKAKGQAAAETLRKKSPLQRLMSKYVFSVRGVTLSLMLISYKMFEYALDYIYNVILVDFKIQRKTIVKTQLFYGSFASLAGAYLGKVLTEYFTVQCKLGAIAAMAICSSARLVSEFFQLVILNRLSQSQPVSSLLPFHAIVENVAGSLLTSSMFSTLLTLSDPLSPSLSYAYLNTLALLGMQIGKFCTQYAKEGEYKSFCLLMWMGNIAFTLLSLLASRQRELIGPID